MAIVETIPMHRSSSVDALNDLLAIEYRSLPMYLCDARPWTHPGDERGAAALKQLAADQNAYSMRIAEMILDRGGTIDPGAFPMEFTDTHLLSLDFLVGELVRYQRADIAAIEQCVAELAADPPARTLAEEVLGNARGHLEELVELDKEMRTHHAAIKV